jgi:hypothetical protein
MFSRLFVALSALLLSGCSALVYQEPTSGPRARVRFVTDSYMITVLRTYSDKNCSDETEWLRLRNAKIFLNSSPKRLGMPLWRHHEHAAKEVYVATDKPVFGMMQSEDMEYSRIYTCAAPFAYKFQQDVDYEVNFNFSKAQCTVQISKIVQTAKGPRLQQLAEFDNRVQEGSEGCMAAFKKKRLY